jgi:hypothetical protein
MCDKVGCDHRPSWHPVVVVRTDLGETTHCMVNLKICDACKGSILLRHLVSDAGWRNLEKNIQNILGRPVRERASLDWVSLDGPEVENVAAVRNRRWLGSVTPEPFVLEPKHA